jgi:hypothetical protein
MTILGVGCSEATDRTGRGSSIGAGYGRPISGCAEVMLGWHRAPGFSHTRDVTSGSCPLHDDRVPLPQSSARRWCLLRDPEIVWPRERRKGWPIRVRLRQLHASIAGDLLGIAHVQADNVRHNDRVGASPVFSRQQDRLPSWQPFSAHYRYRQAILVR